jgi:hypothetical protein
MRDDRLELGWAPRGDLEPVEAAPRVPDHPHSPRAPRLRLEPREHLQSVVVLLRQVLAAQQPVGVPRPAQVDTDRGVAMSREVRVPHRVIGGGAVVLAVRQVLEHRGHGRARRIERTPDACRETRSVGERDPLVFDLDDLVGELGPDVHGRLLPRQGPGCARHLWYSAAKEVARMDKRQWRMRLGITLAVASVALFVLHYLVFRDLHHLGIFTLHDIAFLPLEVLIVTLILHALLEQRQHSELMQKLNMVIGAFFSEVGIDLLKQLAALDSDPESLARRFDLDASWDDKRLKQASAEAASGTYKLNPTHESIQAMHDFLREKRQFLLGLLENQSLLETSASPMRSGRCSTSVTSLAGGPTSSRFPRVTWRILPAIWSGHTAG